MTSEEILKMKQMLFGGLFVVANNLQTVMDRTLAEVGLTSKQWLLLAVMGEFFKDQPPTLKELASSMGTSHQNTKQIALKLQEKGLVALEKDEADKRIVRVKLLITDGHFGEDFDKGARAFLDTFTGDLEAEELAIFLKGIHKITHQLHLMQNREE